MVVVQVLITRAGGLESSPLEDPGFESRLVLVVQSTKAKAETDADADAEVEVEVEAKAEAKAGSRTIK